MPGDKSNVYERISNEYYSLTASGKKVADYVLASQEKTQYLSISELAENSGVAEATISRFCHQLGYRGYSFFKLAVANASKKSVSGDRSLSEEIHEDDTLDNVGRKVYDAEVDALTQTMNVLDMSAVQKAADILQGAKRVLCMGQGGSVFIALEAEHLFSTVCNKFVVIPDSHLQISAAATADPEDVILFFSYSGATTAMMDTFRQVDHRQKIILVTRFPNSPGAEYADVVLQCGSRQNPLQLGSIPAQIAQLYLIDILFTEFARRNMEQCRIFKTRIADALAEKHI